METNPLHIVAGTGWPVLLLNVLLVGGVVFLLYKKEGVGSTYLFLVVDAVVWHTLIRIVAIYHNYSLLSKVPPEVLREVGEAVSTGAKTSQYVLNVAWIYLLPFLLTALTFFVWKKLEKEGV